jgi:hypothetical protein
MIQSAPFLLVILLMILACGDTSSVSSPSTLPSTNTDGPPEWVWVGPGEEAPACPGNRQADWEGWAYEAATGECGACECGPAACMPPSMVTAHGTLCTSPPYDEGVPVTFDAGQGSDGACVAAAPHLPTSAFRSVVFEPPTLALCTPSQPLDPPPISPRFARACPSNVDEEPPGSFIPCIAPEPDGSCRPGFSDRMEFTERFVDNRTCTPCACSLPVGGSCLVDVFLYGDATCTSTIAALFWLGLDMTPCHDTPAPLPLSAVRMVRRQEDPGACMPISRISEVVGTVEQGDTRVFCCNSKDSLN